MELTYNWKINQQKYFMAIPWKVTWNKHIISYREKQPLDSLPWLSAHLTSSPPPSVTKSSTNHKKGKVVSFILLREITVIYCLVSQIAFVQQSSPRTVVLGCSTGLQKYGLSPLPLQPWPQPLGSPQFCQKQISFFFNYTPLLWMMPTSIHSFIPCQLF